MKRTLYFSLPLLFFACDAGDAASPFVTERADDGGATFVDAAADGTTTNPETDGSTPADGGTCVTFGADGGADAAPPAALVTAMSGATAGQVVPLAGWDETSAPTLAVAVCPEPDAPTLLFSDSPEKPSTDGILYADTVEKGKYRLYVYQANGGNQQRKFPVVVFNPGPTNATVTITRRGVVATTSDPYVAIGKQVVADWLTARAPVDVVVPPMSRILLDDDLNARTAKQNELVHAIFDVETSAQLKFTFVSILANGNAVAQTAGFAVLPADSNHQRGTFPNADITIRAAMNAQQRGVQRFRLGGGGVDATLQGVDRASPDGGAPQSLVGNYGMLYRIELGVPTTARAGISPRGGPWGGVAREGLDGGATNLALPSAAETAGTTDAIVLPQIGVTTKMSLMSAGGSSLPIDVFLLTP